MKKVKHNKLGKENSNTLEIIKKLNIQLYDEIDELPNINSEYRKVISSINSFYKTIIKNNWDPVEIIGQSDFLEKFRNYRSHKDKITLEKFKTILPDAELKYKEYCARKTKSMRTFMDENPDYCDTRSIEYFMKKYNNAEIAKDKRSEFIEGVNYNTRVDYYTKKGHSLEEANAILKERQRTFSKEKCISKHGKEIGLDIWNDRQAKWQKTLGEKSYSEQLLIKFKKSPSFLKSVSYFLGISESDYSDDLFKSLIDKEKDFIGIMLENFTKTVEEYSYKTRKLTSINFAKYKSFIDPDSKRSSDFHLDHKYSVLRGFLDGVSPNIIAHPCNLEIISENDNRKKSAKCSISLDDLNILIADFSVNNCITV